jgi:glycosyltransferase involved in cell wall biosynthesis
MTSSRYRLAIVASHPIQYHAPWYRALASLVDLHVFFAHRIGAADHVQSGFGVPFEWDVPLFDGYRSEWLENRSARPGVDHFRGCDTPGVRAALERGRFDALLVTGWNLLTFWQATRAATRLGMLVLVRGDSQLPSARGALWRAAKRLIYPRLLGAFDAFLTVGTRSEEYYRYYRVPSTRLFRSPHCVDNEFFARAAELVRRSIPDPRQAFGIPREAPVFLFAGKLVDKKRPLDFLAALDRLRRDNQPAWGLVVGDGPLRQQLEDHRRRRATPFTMIGFLNQQQIGRAYAVADAVVLPSDGRETWGLVVNEGMACGVPAIVSDEVGCAPDLVLNGDTGFTYPCGDIQQLSDRMTRFASDPELRQRMRARSSAHIQAFSPEAAAAGVVKALESLRPRRASAA